MAEAIVSMVVERIGSIIEHQIREEVNLVRGVDKKIVNLSEELKTIRYVLDDAEKKGLVGTGAEPVRNWLKKLENASYELDDVLDEWYTALRKFQIQQGQKRKVCNCSTFISIPSCFQKLAVHRDIAKKLEKMNENIDSILAEKDRYGLVTTETPHPSTNDWRVQSTSFVDSAEIYGRDFETDYLVRRVISTMPEVGDQTNHLEILSVVGVGGVGKTTLAQLVYNDSRVTECFGLRMWICVSDPFDEMRVVKNIIESVAGNSPDSNQLEVLLKRLKECILGKKFLLVMDDVWTDDSSGWKPLITSLKNGSIGSKVLITTRNEMVAKKMGTLEDEIHHLGALSDKNCWLLLQRTALFGRDEGEWKKFEGVGMNIANKCRGLPLAAKALGSLLYFKNRLEEWVDVYNSEIWELERPKGDIFPHLRLSYNQLSPTLKRCFSYCAVFPKDVRIDVEELIGHWMAVGYLGSDENGAGDMELKGREYFDNLAVRSLFQDFEKNKMDGQIVYCKMHDIVHDFALSLRKNGDGEATMKKTSTCESCSPSLVSHAKEYRSVYFGNKEPHWLGCSCLANLRVVSLKEFGKQSCAWSFVFPNWNLHEIERFIHLRWLDLSWNDLAPKDLETICGLYNLQTLVLHKCNLKEITSEIGNLINLRHLNLSGNESLWELPDSVCGLYELQRLNIDGCRRIWRLPQGFDRLVNLKHLHSSNTSLRQFPLQGVAQLTGLRTLNEFNAGSGRGKLGWLKNLNRLSGSLTLNIELDGSENIVEDAREGGLMKKDCIQELVIRFDGRLDGDWEWVSLLDALEPQPNIMRLGIFSYKGSKLPSWMSFSPLNQLKFIGLHGFSELSSLPPLGRLPCLEEIAIYGIDKLQVVGQEFLVTTTEGSNSNSTIAFPKLKKLFFFCCDNWSEWKDITTIEEAAADSSEAFSIMPNLTELVICRCNSLTALPHCLLASSSLEKLDICGSTQLKTRYGDIQGSAWKSLLEVCPRLRLVIPERDIPTGFELFYYLS